MEKILFFNIIKFFTESPYQEIYLRQLAKKLKLSPFATKKYADLLIQENLILEERKANLRYFKANTQGLFYKHLKIALNINKIEKSNLIKFIKEKVSNVSSIILFGSMARGEDEKNSDIDLVVIGKDKYLDLSKFEEILDKEINIHSFNWAEWNKQAKNNTAFYNDVISHGLPLYGELPIIQWK